MRIGTKIILSFATLFLFSMSPQASENLLDIYRLAEESDPQLRAAIAAHQATLESKPISRASLLPNISLDANITRNDSSYEGSTSFVDSEYTSKGYSLNLLQPIYHHDYWVQLRQADSQIAQADAELNAARQDLVARVATAYFTLLAAQDNLEFAEAEEKATSQQLNQAKQRFEVGLTAITDVHEAQAGYDTAVATVISANNQVDNAVEELHELTGQEHRDLAPVAANIPLVSPEPADIDQWVESALKQNLQLLAAEASAQTAMEEIKRRSAGHYPSFDLVASHSYNDTSDNPNFSGSERTDNNVGVQLSLPIYSGGLTTSQTRQARALHNQSLDNVERQRRATTRLTREAYLAVMTGISQVRARKQALISAETALEATQAGFDVGTRTSVDVLNSTRDRFRARQDYAASRYEYIKATLTLKLANGSLTEAELAKVNNWLNLSGKKEPLL